MRHKTYLNGTNQNLKRAFLDGCESIMAVLRSHLQYCSPEELHSLLRRTDEDWIRCLCDNEQKRLDGEQLAVMENTLQHFYPIDRQLFRGMLLNCNCVNDEGYEVDGEGRICDNKPYPYQFYEDMHSKEYPPRVISNEEYSQLPPDEQSNYMRCCYVELENKNGGPKRRFTDSDRAFMTAVLAELLPNEPQAVCELYKSALKKGNQTIQAYRDVFEEYTDIGGFSESGILK